jgi:hypothetical protein
MVVKSTKLVDRDQAIESAKRFVREHAYPVRGVISCELDRENFHKEWVVQFDLKMPDDVVGENEVLLVVVNGETGITNLFETL